MNRLRYNAAAYDDAYYDSHEPAVLRSARVVVPLVVQALSPASVLDVGCGRGGWLRVFAENGVPVVRGVDGPFINPSKLLIDPAWLTTVDLSRPFQLEGRYDLATCLEVIEHLPLEVGPSLVENLTRAAPLVLFSAAVPGQGGTGHINEQWPAYWRAEFARHGFHRLDPFRRHILSDPRVAWWYRQNLFLFASAEALAASPVLQAEAKAPDSGEFELLHVNVLDYYSETYRYQSLRALLAHVPRVAWNSLRRVLLGQH